jgi:alpha-tubulin suppressor-like RCC1 family protein
VGNNEYGQSGNGKVNKLGSIYKLDFFEKKNLKIKKIVCGYRFIIFLTGLFKK